MHKKYQLTIAEPHQRFKQKCVQSPILCMAFKDSKNTVKVNQTFYKLKICSSTYEL